MAKQSSFPPVYNEKSEKAYENLRLALPLLNQHKAPVNPVNYAVWYEYVSGENSVLSHAVDALLKSDGSITDEATQHLYEKYVLMNMPERLEKTNRGIQLVVDNTLSNINDVESTTNQCLSGFNDSQMALEECNDVNDLKSLISGILADTQKMSQTSNDLKQNLEQSAQEISNLRQELEAVKESAQTDALTGLFNRGALNKKLHTVCGSNSTNVALLIFDLDNFKTINDTFGHPLGDKVIQYFASLLQKNTGPHHLAARYGGEEMVMVLTNVSQQDALDLAELIRINFANSRLKKKGSETSIGQVTVSVGISMKKASDSLTDLIERADTALYRSKENGRNQVNIT
ncbi:MAG: diguanylate cyclase [Methylophaga sp.]|nr:diguanylate cyclase [Methylophaga sp.]